MFRARFWPITARPARPIREREADSMVVGVDSVERERIAMGGRFLERESGWKWRVGVTESTRK